MYFSVKYISADTAIYLCLLIKPPCVREAYVGRFAFVLAVGWCLRHANITSCGNENEESNLEFDQMRNKRLFRQL